MSIMNILKDFLTGVAWGCLFIVVFSCGYYAAMYFDFNYQAGSKSKIDDCEYRLSRDTKCVLVAVEDESD